MSEQIGGQQWPNIPVYLGNPIVFRDKNLGIAMVADYQGKQWVFKVSSGNWMTVRPVTDDDPMLILEPLNQAPASPPDAKAGAGLTVDNLAQLIRIADPEHNAGAGEMAEKILPWILAARAVVGQGSDAPRPTGLAGIKAGLAEAEALDPGGSDALRSLRELSGKWRIDADCMGPCDCADELDAALAAFAPVSGKEKD